MTSEFDLEIEQVRSEFDITNDDIIEISNKLYKDMSEKKYLKMLESKIYIQDKFQLGEYIALDIGNSNLKVMIYEITDNGKYILKNSKKIRMSLNIHNMHETFRQAVNIIKELIEPNRQYYLGHTFSFMFVSTTKNNASIVIPNLETNIMQEYDINEILSNLLKNEGLNVTPMCVINDTVAILMAGRFVNPITDMSCVIGTGYNMGMVNNNNEIINLESGNYNEFKLNKYDELYIKSVGKPASKCHLMNTFSASGNKSSMIAINIMQDFVDKNLMEYIEDITPEMMSAVFKSIYNENLNNVQKKFLECISPIIFQRGAKYITAQIIAILKYIDPNLDNEHNIIFDGSVVENVPYLEYIKENLKQIYIYKADKITFSFLKDASGLGAAVTAAMK